MRLETNQVVGYTDYYICPVKLLPKRTLRYLLEESTVVVAIKGVQEF